MEIKQYAPVLIPTLNRYEHFINCLESLEKCTGADKTDVYVALDFPPSEKYRNGWEKIDSYLVEKEKSNGFNKLVVIRREKNCGIGHDKCNYSLLRDYIMTLYDRYIFTEDDNVFSPNFLEFLNKGLELYKDDMRILQVCAYNYQIKFPPSYKNNFYFSRHGSPWGCGFWTNRYPIISKYRSINKMGQLIKDENVVKKLKKERPSTLRSIINMIKNNQIYGDSVNGTISTLEDMYFLMPTISKVKNLGTDGTGAHATSINKNVIDYFKEQQIDTASSFDFTNDIFTVKPINTVEQYMPINKFKEAFKQCVFKIDYFLWKYFNFVPKSKYI